MTLPAAHPPVHVQPHVTDIAALPERSLLLVDDDKPFLTRLQRAMESRGFLVTTADSVASGLAAHLLSCAGLCGY